MPRDVSSAPASGPPGSRRPGLLLALAALVGLQGVAVVGLGVLLAVDTAVATSGDTGRAVVAALLTVLAGVGLLLVARGLARGGRWARSPALVANLIALPVGVGLVQAGRWYVGGPLLVWAVAVLVLLFAGPVNAALEDADDGGRR